TAAFLGSTLLSSLLSEEVALSVRRGVPLLPCVLLFVLVAASFDVPHVKALYATFTGLAAVLGLRLLAQFAGDPTGTPTSWVERIGGPLLVVPNDVIFLVGVMPLSLALVVCRASRGLAALGLTTVVLNLVVAVVVQSRG